MLTRTMWILLNWRGKIWVKCLYLMNSLKWKVKRETGCLGFGKIGRGQSTCLHPLCSECVVFLLFSPYVHVCVVFLSECQWGVRGLFCFFLLVTVTFIFHSWNTFEKKLLSGENFQLPRKEQNEHVWNKTECGWRRFSPHSRVIFLLAD